MKAAEDKDMSTFLSPLHSCFTLHGEHKKGNIKSTSLIAQIEKHRATVTVTDLFCFHIWRLEPTLRSYWRGQVKLKCLRIIKHVSSARFLRGGGVAGQANLSKPLFRLYGSRLLQSNASTFLIHLTASTRYSLMKQYSLNVFPIL